MITGIKILSRWTSEVIYHAPEATTIKEAVEAALKAGAILSRAVLRDAILSHAVLRDADLRRAILSGAVLRRAVLSSANLSHANLRGAVLPDDRLWEEYRADHLAGLCSTPEIRAKAIAAWGKHSWTDCPMHAALGITGPEGAGDKAKLVAAWVALYDARLLERPSDPAEQLAARGVGLE